MLIREMQTKLKGVDPAWDWRGLAADRPAPNAVPVGTTYWSVDTDVHEVSTGVAWVTYVAGFGQ
jgi:hypothetical protein